MADQYLPRTLEITVTGSSGTVSIPSEYAGLCVGVCIQSPTSSQFPRGNPDSTYDFEVFDSEGFGQIGAAGCQGTGTLRDEFQIHAGGSIDLTNVSLAGVYRARIWYAQ